MRHAIQGICLLAAATAAVVVPALGQPGPGSGGDSGGFGGPGGRGGPPPFQQRQGAGKGELKDALDVSDEQWKALDPMISHVQELQRDVATGRGGMPPMGMGGPEFGMGGPPDRPGEARRGPGGQRGGRGGPATRPSDPRGPTTHPARAFGMVDPQDLQRGGGRPDGGRGGFGPRMAAKPSKVTERLLDLQEALDDRDVKPEVLRAKIDAFHRARDEARAELTQAEAKLRAAVTPMQEAVLITMGVLD